MAFTSQKRPLSWPKKEKKRVSSGRTRKKEAANPEIESHSHAHSGAFHFHISLIIYITQTVDCNFQLITFLSLPVGQSCLPAACFGRPATRPASRRATFAFSQHSFFLDVRTYNHHRSLSEPSILGPLHLWCSFVVHTYGCGAER